MKPDPAEPADRQNLLRQQLLLAQVRIMELEDLRDSLAPRIKELEQLLQRAQALADHKLDEAGHLEKVLADTRAHADHVQALHHHAAQELAAARRNLAAAEEQRKQDLAAIAALESAQTQLGREIRKIRASRSWRWTAWLRALGGD